LPTKSIPLHPVRSRADRASAALNRTVADPSFLLLYSPLQFGQNEMAKPDGSLSLPYLAGALREAGFQVALLDISVGNEKDDLQQTFFNPVALPSGLFRLGMSENRVLEEAARYDVICISSIFTAQTRMVLDTVRLIKKAFPEKLIVAGGVNARSLAPRFFDAGVDLIALSEGDRTIVEIGAVLRQGSRDFGGVPGITMRVAGQIVSTRKVLVIDDLDELPVPAWDLLPLDKYWAISRPHGGDFPPGQVIRYAEIMTSRGCPFACTYCHVSKESPDDVTGSIGSYRVKSLERVVRELEILKGLGTEYVFVEDDSLLAKKKRIIEIFRAMRGMGLHFADVNGVNIVHLFTNSGGRLVPDRELLEMMVEVGFETLTLPFESANQRILDRYATRKWRTDRCDTVALVRACQDVGLTVSGNFMIGYPDESREEVFTTIEFAKKHIDAGLNVALFFCVIPYPGCKLFDDAIANGQLDADFDPDIMKWTNPVLKNTAISAAELMEIRRQAWVSCNRPEYIAYKTGMNVEKLASAATPASPG
jgi:anaerobic magnesium-protoporphyrin IX monomethyl ester cyclase